MNSLYKFEEQLTKQNEKGLKKYGQALDPLDGRYCFLSMAMEEQVDGFQYLHAEMIKRKHVADEIRKLVKFNTIPMVHDQINTLLDQLEGKH